MHLFTFPSPLPPQANTARRMWTSAACSPTPARTAATCSNLIGSYVCVCVNGWSGTDCSENIDDCASAACSVGSTCTDRVASFICFCPYGKTGGSHTSGPTARPVGHSQGCTHQVFLGQYRCLIKKEKYDQPIRYRYSQI